MPQLQEIMVTVPKRLNLSCADLVADYDTESQEGFIEIYSIEGYQISKATMQYIVRQCPPPTPRRQAILASWQKAKAAAGQRLAAPAKKTTFNRKKFEPYLSGIGNEAKLEAFLNF